MGTVVHVGVIQDGICGDSCTCWCNTGRDLWGQLYILMYHRTGSVWIVVHAGVSILDPLGYLYMLV